jgi:predicted AlkP superfamily phosphohydrolase/phosphomutase
VSTPKLTVVGLDAATFDVIDPLVEAGELPNLARLFEAGSRGILRSVTHPLTPHAWATMTTGVNAGRHGIWDFSERVGGGYELKLINGSYRRAPAVWDRLAAAGVGAGIMNVPFTWPAPEVTGFAISGFDAAAREEGLTFPRDLVGEIHEKFGPLVLDHRFPIGKDGGIDLELVRAAAEQKVEVALWLAERFQPQLLFVVFMAADHVHHICWDDWEQRGAESAVAEVYRILDRATGALADAAGPHGDVLVVSDHGGGRLDGVVNLNAYLASRGLLTYRGADAAVGRRLARRLFELRRRLPQGIRTSVKRRLPRVRERAYEATTYTVIDWAHTKAFAYGTFGNVIVNLEGRERDGTVAPADYERVCGEVADALLALRGPDGEQIVAAVHRREDLFHGPELEKVPDLIVEFDRYTWLGKGNLRSRGASLWDRIELEPGSRHSYVGSHRHEGVMALAGPSARKGGKIAADIADVAPTILYLLSQPLATDFDGRLVTEGIDSGVLEQRPPEYADLEGVSVGVVESYDADDEESVEERLRSLGYLE